LKQWMIMKKVVMIVLQIMRLPVSCRHSVFVIHLSLINVLHHFVHTISPSSSAWS
jgi:hypothetical protein